VFKNIYKVRVRGIIGKKLRAGSMYKGREGVSVTVSLEVFAMAGTPDKEEGESRQGGVQVKDSPPTKIRDSTRGKV